MISAEGRCFEEVRAEFIKASSKFAPFNSAHEGYAIIKEELDELWDEVKDDKRTYSERSEAMRAEAVQVAAMALRFIVDVTPNG